MSAGNDSIPPKGWWRVIGRKVLRAVLIHTAVPSLPDLAHGIGDEDVYPYKRLRECGIRLLSFHPNSTTGDIRCTLEQYDTFFEDKTRPDFTALSYVWGDSSIKKSITLNGRQFNVTTNLWDALNYIQYNDRDDEELLAPPWYWIDAICLNQNDVRERSEQVHHMWRIYSGAYKVISWLGLSSRLPMFINSSSRLFADSPSRLSTDSPSRLSIDLPSHHSWLSVPSISPGGGEKKIDDEDDFVDFRKAGYFHRTWIISEFAQARELTLMSGENKLNLRCLHNEDFKRFLPAVVRDRLWGNSTPITNSADAEGLSELLEMYSQSCCSDQRDRIFAMQSHPRIQESGILSALQPDYLLDQHELAFIVAEAMPRLPMMRCHTRQITVSLVTMLWWKEDMTRTDRGAFRVSLLSSTLCKWVAPDVLVLRSGRRISCSTRRVRSLVGFVFTGSISYYETYGPDFSDPKVAEEHIREATLRPETESLLREWPAIYARWQMEDPEFYKVLIT